MWLIGTASEHHVIYQYNIHNASNHYMGLIQTETVRTSFVAYDHVSSCLHSAQPYFQPTPAVPEPFTIDAAYSDPDTAGLTSALALSVTNSKNILVFGT